MKKILFCILLMSFTCVYSQSWKELTFKQYNDASTKNELSKYFKKEIPKRLLKKITYNNSFNYITLSFYINKEMQPYNVKTNSLRNKELNEALIEAFKKYPLDQLNLDKESTRKMYFFEVIAKKGNRNLINCSNTILSKTLPASNLCDDLDVYEDQQKCIENNIRKHFYKNIDFSLADHFTKDQPISISLNLAISANAELVLKRLQAPNIFQKSISEIIKMYPKFDKPAIVNGDSISHPYNFSITFKKGDRPTYKETNNYYDSIFKPNSTNDFALFMATKLKQEDFKIANLNRIKNNINLNFELDKNNTPFNIRTTARSSTLDKKIIEAFKEYPINKLNFSNISRFNSYFTKIAVLEKETISIKTNSLMGYFRVPVFPGCENSMNIKSTKSCFSKGIQMHFIKKFDSKLPNKLGLSKGRKGVYIYFKINKEGYISDINVKAPHVKIKEEVINVMKTLPKIQPGMQADKTVNVKYSIPFTLIVD